MFGSPTVQTPQQQLNYRRRQQAGIDALIAIATPVVSAEEPHEETSGNGEGPVVTNRNAKRS
jgi:hypothetical protein